MDYYDSAEGLLISHERTLIELKSHGCEELELFYQEMGKLKSYSAQAVLRWLGY